MPWFLASPWASYQIHKIAGCACAGNAGNVFPRRRFQRKPLVSDPGMHHGTCGTHVPWCMSGSLTCGDREKGSRHSRRLRTRYFAYLARGLCFHQPYQHSLIGISLTSMDEELDVIKIWINNWIHVKQWDVINLINLPCPNRKWSLVKRPLKLGHV